MNFGAGLVVWVLLVTSLIQYIAYENWQASIYFLICAGFYALYNVTKNPVYYKDCNFIFSREDKEEKQE